MDYLGCFLKNNCDLPPPALQVAFLRKEGSKISIVSLRTNSLSCENFPLTVEGKALFNYAQHSTPLTYSRCAHWLNSVKRFYTGVLFPSSLKTHITSGLSGTEVFVRALILPLKERQKLLKALPFQIETLLPFSQESGVVCPIIAPADHQATAITLVASTREIIQNHLDQWEGLKIQPDCISCEPSALARFIHWKFPEETKILSFYVSQQELLYTVSIHGRLLLSQTLVISEKERLPYELEKLSTYLKQKGAINEKTPWVLIESCNDKLLMEQFSSAFPNHRLQVDDTETKEYAIPIGLALDSIAKDSFSVQFSQKEFTPYPTCQRRNNRLFLYTFFCLIGAVLTTLCGSFPLKKKKRTLVSQVYHALPSSLSLPETPSVEEIEEVLLKWEKSLFHKKNPFPLLPTTPKLSDVLAWASTHPTFSTESGEKKEGITLTSLHYQLTKYPKVGESNSPYQGALSLEFSTETPRLARDFHDALLKGDSIVNHKKEITWQVQNQQYFTSFEVNRKNPL